MRHLKKSGPDAGADTIILNFIKIWKRPPLPPIQWWYARWIRFDVILRACRIAHGADRSYFFHVKKHKRYRKKRSSVPIIFWRADTSHAWFCYLLNSFMFFSSLFGGEGGGNCVAPCGRPTQLNRFSVPIIFNKIICFHFFQ